MTDHDALVSDLRSIADDAVLGIGVYDGGDYDVLFIRDDFAQRYAQDRLDEIARDMYLEGVSVEYQQQMLNDMGDLNATIRLFDGGTSINVPLSENAGVGVGLDDTASLSEVGDIVARCVDFREAQYED
ncbi:hypothetical protein [Salinirubrum litoreum]|uniref:Uncharacterized protein n=1 Tax=Salinirubrum litoreum TaxID=1126234 RepID=A0ABD5REV0_9EURY|nr:hypothetical protein [Salinirubrum litoreum]